MPLKFNIQIDASAPLDAGHSTHNLLIEAQAFSQGNMVPCERFKFVFNPRWDMHSLRAKEIKDSPNSQVVPKILVLLKNGTVWFHNCSG